MSSKKEISDFFPIVEEAWLAPVIWSEVSSYADSVDETSVLVALNNIVLALRYPDSEWIHFRLQNEIDIIMAEVMKYIPGIGPEAYEYVADYVKRVITYYLRNPSFFPETES